MEKWAEHFVTFARGGKQPLGKLNMILNKRTLGGGDGTAVGPSMAINRRIDQVFSIYIEPTNSSCKPESSSNFNLRNAQADGEGFGVMFELDRACVRPGDQVDNR